MNKSISTNLTISLLCTVVIVAVTALGVYYYQRNEKWDLQLETKANEYINLISETVKIPLWNMDNKLIETYGKFFSQNDLIISIEIKDTFGRDMFFYNIKTDAPKIYRAKTIELDGEIVGYVSMSLSKKMIKELRKGFLLISSITVGMILAALILTTGLMLKIFLKKPLENMSEIVDSYAKEHYDFKATDNIPKEFQSFIKVLNDMGNKLQEQMTALRRAEEKYRDIFENATEGIFQTTPDGYFLSANPSLATIMGYENPQDLVSSVSDIANQLYVIPNDRSLFRYGVIEQGQIKNFETKIYKRNGDIIDVSINARFVCDDLNNKCYYEGSISDITHRKRAEALLRESEEKYRELVQNASSIILRMDKNGNVTFFNEFAQNFFGYSENEIIGKSIIGTIVPQTAHDGKTYKELVQDIINNPEKYKNNENENIKRNGERVWVAWNNKSVLDEKGQLVGVLCIGMDISERKRYEEALKRAKETAETADRVKTEFLANMSHEMRTPMNSVLGIAEILKNSALSGSQKEHLIILYNSAKRLMKLINEILGLSELEEKNTEFKNISFNLFDVVNNACSNMLDDAREKHLEMIWKVNENVPRFVIGDPSRIEQLLTDLIDNSIKFTHTGRILVKCEIADDSQNLKTDKPINVIFSVKDTGIGIEESMKEKIFDLFTQVDSSFTRKYGGVGMGLTICKRIIEKMKGHIWVESEIGKGSTFYFSVPFNIDFKSQESQPNDINEIEKMPLHVLLVEDHPNNQLVFAMQLIDTPFEIEMADNGKIGVEKFMKSNYDVVFMDIQMPVMDGHEATGKIREWELLNKRKPTPIIALTAHALKRDYEKSFQAGCNDHVVKPYEKKDLLKGIFNARRHLITNR